MQRPDPSQADFSSVASKLAIGGISYLNSAPLIWGLREVLGDLDGHPPVRLDIPSRLADRFAAGALDLALIPTVEHFRISHASRISDVCIASDGPVESVILLANKPLKQIRKIAVDEGSRTSATLVSILIAEEYGQLPELSVLNMGLSPRETGADAVVLIGDRAWQSFHTGYTGFSEMRDIGQWWVDLTGLPFVFALWAASRRIMSDETEIARMLECARDVGLANISKVVSAQSLPTIFSIESIKKYLTETIHYKLGERHVEGMELFRTLADKHGLLQTPVDWPSIEED